MDFETKTELFGFLSEYITENKKQKFEEVLKSRTRYLTVVLEDLYQSHNASAVLRSCDCFGIQDVHVVENRNEFKPSKDIALGSYKWLDVIKHNQQEHNTLACFDYLRERGYKIYATSPHKDDMLLSDIPLDDKVALVFGTELEGLSKTALEHADAFVKIPMYGFTESFNISVSAAISLYAITEKLHQSDLNWQLQPNELLDIKLEWARKVIRKCEVFEKQFFKMRTQS